MSFKAEVYRILIASPGDTEDERSVIPDVINDWNAASAEKEKINAREMGNAFCSSFGE